MFDFMARADFTWTNVRIFWVDERAVPPNDEQSNYRLVDEHLLKPARISHRNVYRVYGELQPQQAARRYKNDLMEAFEIAEGDFPHFDVIHLGMGADAHTASLFPGEPLIDDRQNLAAAVHVPKLATWRITLLPGVLLAAHHLALLVAGADKAPALGHVFNGKYDPHQYPAQILARNGQRAKWFLDAPAAHGLD
jgi:6-phosphogluconolactonase